MNTFKEYEDAVMPLAVYPGHESGDITYPALGLAGETSEALEKLLTERDAGNHVPEAVIDSAMRACIPAGRIAEHAKKTLRDNGGVVSPERRALILKEAGDELWYLADIARQLGSSLSEVAEINAKKLLDRKERNVIKGEGDSR